MHSERLAGVRLKIARAEEHLKQADVALEAARPTLEDDNSLTGIQEFDRQRKILIVRAPKPKSLAPNLQTIIGDAIHNARCALDHLVFQLALLKSPGDKDAASRTFFPITLKKSGKSGFDELVERRVKPFISAAALAEIEGCQPYKAYAVPEESDIWILAQLDNFDKHRLLVVAEHRMLPHEFTLTVPTGETFKCVIPNPPWKRLEEGAELIRFNLSKAIRAPGEVKVQLETIMMVQIAETGLFCDGVGVHDAIAQCIRLARIVVDDFGRKFFEE